MLGTDTGTRILVGKTGPLERAHVRTSDGEETVLPVYWQQQEGLQVEHHQKCMILTTKAECWSSWQKAISNDHLAKGDQQWSYFYATVNAIIAGHH